MKKIKNLSTSTKRNASIGLRMIDRLVKFNSRPGTCHTDGLFERLARIRQKFEDILNEGSDVKKKN